MQQSGNVSADKAAPPFATRDGQPTVKSTGAGAHVAESRPQSEARPEVVPSTGEMPKGGKILFADPTGQSGQSGTVHGVAGETPFKNLK